LIKLKKYLVDDTNYKSGRYAQHMLKFSPKTRLGMLINVMLIKKTCIPLNAADWSRD